MCGLFSLHAATPSAAPQSTVSSNLPQASSITWTTDFTQALDSAKKGNKPLLLFFTGSDWCGWCKKLQQEVFADPLFVQEVGDHFVFVEIDFPMNGSQTDAQKEANNKLKEKYGVSGYPTIVLLNPQGDFVAETGYRSGGGKLYAQHLKELME